MKQKTDKQNKSTKPEVRFFLKIAKIDNHLEILVKIFNKDQERKWKLSTLRIKQ